LVTQLKDELDVVREKTADIKQALNTAEIITKTTNAHVQVGSQVTIQVKSARQTITIVGDVEANPAKNYISDQSPLGQALLGKKPGQEISVEAPVGKITYKILQID
jgi:transcription elongation factor GreA